MSRFNTWSPEELAPEKLAQRSAAIRRRAELVLLVQKPYVFLEDDYFGLVENSFSMSIEENRAFVYFDATEAYGMTARAWAERDRAGYQKLHPGWKFAIWSVDDPRLPVVLNWDLWLDGHAPSNETLAGVKNKHEARNIRFYPRSQPPPRWWKQATVPGLTPMVTTTRFPVPLTVGQALAVAQLHDHTQAAQKIQP